MRFTSQHKASNQKEYGKAVSPLRYDSLALILCRSIFVVYGKQSEKNKYICSSKRHSALHTFWDTTRCFRNSGSVTYVSTLPSPLVGPWCPACTLPSSSAPCISSFVQHSLYVSLIRQKNNGDTSVEVPPFILHFVSSILLSELGLGYVLCSAPFV